MVNWLKITPQVGARVRTASVSGIVETITDQHVLIRISGWCRRDTCCWIARNQLKGIYK